MSASAYTSASEMVSRYGKRLHQALSGADGNIANADTITANTRLLEAIESGNALVDGYVIGRYAPADVLTNQILIDAASTLAFYRLVSYYRGEMMTDLLSREAEDTRRTLSDIATGKMQLTFEPTDRTQALASPGRAASGTNADGTRRTTGDYTWMDQW